MSNNKKSCYFLIAWIAAVNAMAIVPIVYLGHLPAFYTASNWASASLCLVSSILYTIIAIRAVQKREGEGPLLLCVGLISANWLGLALLDWLL